MYVIFHSHQQGTKVTLLHILANICFFLFIIHILKISWYLFWTWFLFLWYLVILSTFLTHIDHFYEEMLLKLLQMWELDYKESWAPRNSCFSTVVLEKTLESPLDCKEIQPVLNVHWKSWCWSWNSNTSATWCEELTHLKRPWCWERFKAGGDGDDRGWDGWMASPTQWTWVLVNSRSWWWTGRPGVLLSIGSQRVGHDWVTERLLLLLSRFSRVQLCATP